MRFPRPTHRVIAPRHPERRPAVTGLVLFVFALKIAVDALRRRRARTSNTETV